MLMIPIYPPHITMIINEAFQQVNDYVVLCISEGMTSQQITADKNYNYMMDTIQECIKLHEPSSYKPALPTASGVH